MAAVTTRTPPRAKPDSHPPPVIVPSTSIVAKALLSFWWTSRLYGITDDEAQELSAHVVRQGGKAVALVHYKAESELLTVVFKGDLALAEKLLDPTHAAELVPTSFLCSTPSAEPEVHKELYALYNGVMGEPTDGISSATATVFDVIAATLRAAPNHAPRNVTCTGFGVGGALASLAAVRLALRFPGADVSCIAHGAPLVGNEAFAKMFKLLVAQSFRIRLADDAVTKVPQGMQWYSAPVFDVNCASPNRAPANSHAEVAYLAGLGDLGSTCDVVEGGAANFTLGCRKPRAFTLKELLFKEKGPMWDNAEERLRDGKYPTAAAGTAAVCADKCPQLNSYLKDLPPGIITKVLDDWTATIIKFFFWWRKKGLVGAQHHENPTPEFKHVDPPADQAGEAKALATIASHICRLPLHLAAAAYADSPTSEKQHQLGPAATQEEQKKDDFWKWGSSVKPAILKYKLIDDMKFEPKGDTDAQAYVCWLEGRTAVFAFRGSSDGEDFVADGRFAEKTMKGGPQITATDAGVKPDAIKVHTGFASQFDALTLTNGTKPVTYGPDLAGTLKELMKEAGDTPDKMPARIICCGHSLGGALATRGAVWAAELWPLSPVSLFTFGEPRGGNLAYVTAVEAVVGTRVRCIHQIDPVPLVPLHFHLNFGSTYNHWYPAGYLKKLKDGQLDFDLSLNSDKRMCFNADDHHVSATPEVPDANYYNRLAEYTKTKAEAPASSAP